MKNKIVGIGVILFIFGFILIWITSHHSQNQWKNVTEIYITIIDNSFAEKRTSRSLVINNPTVIKELIKPFKKFELVYQKEPTNTLYTTDYEIKMNNGYKLTFEKNWNNFDKGCYATFNDNRLEHCAPKDFILKIKNIIEQNT